MTVRQFSGRLSWRPNIAGLVTMAICGLVWEMAIQVGIFDYQYLPAPSAITRGAGELAASGELITATLHTLESVFLGWTIAVAAGVSFGLLLGSSPLLRRYSLATIEVLRPMPAIAFVPVALLLFEEFDGFDAAAGFFEKRRGGIEILVRIAYDDNQTTQELKRPGGVPGRDAYLGEPQKIGGHKLVILDFTSKDKFDELASRLLVAGVKKLVRCRPKNLGRRC